MMKQRNELERNLSNPELTGQLLFQAQQTTKMFREILWKEGTDWSSGISTLKAATRLLENSIDKLIPKEPLEDDTKQLKLEL